MKDSKKSLIGIDIFKSEYIKLIEILIKKITKPKNEIRVEFELFLFAKTGILKTKKLLQKQLEKFKNKKIEIRLIVPPIYFIFLSNQHKKRGIKLLISFLLELSEIIKRQKGNLTIRRLITK